METAKNSIPIDPTRICYVCGFNFDLESSEERQDWPFIFCPCCCFEFGFDDNDYDCFTVWRKEWIRDGLQFGYRLLPDDYRWTLDIAIVQLDNLKLVNIKNYPWGEKMNPNYTSIVDIEEVKREWYKHRNEGG